jgi:hypothetical protein
MRIFVEMTGLSRGHNILAGPRGLPRTDMPGLLGADDFPEGSA